MEQANSNALKGAIREMKVANDLMSRDFEVYAPLGTFKCDLVARKNGICVAIEVKGRKEKIGTKTYSPVHPSASNGKHRPIYKPLNFDVLATVHDDGEIIYRRSCFIKEASTVAEELYLPTEKISSSTRHSVLRKWKETTDEAAAQRSTE